jgi:CheY-like chemotaxis protein
MRPTKILIIDDDKQNVRYLTTILEETGFNDIHAAYDGEEGLEKVRELMPGLILLDLRMPKKNGIMVFNDLKSSEEFRDIPVIILTGEGGFLKHLSELREYREDQEPMDEKATEEVLGRFISSRPDGFLEKPVEPDRLVAVIGKLLITLDEVKEEKKQAVDALLEEKLAGGVMFNGSPFDSSEPTRNDLAALAAMLAGGAKELPEGFSWRSSDNSDMVMDKSTFMAFQAAVTDWVYNTRKASWEHKSAIDALEDIRAAEDYDISGGWPGSDLGA